MTDKDHTPACAAAFDAWATAWNRNATAHRDLERAWEKAARKCGCLQVVVAKAKAKAKAALK